MSIFLFGISHRSAPVPILERLAVTDIDRPKLIEDLLDSPQISEAMIVSTCNRVEVYAVVDAFHPALEAVGEVMGRHSGMTVNEMTKYAYVRYSEAVVEHLFSVAAGLDSMVVGEQQILGQIRSSYASADANRSAGRVLHELAQQALRVGKRVHSETGLDRAGASVVSVSLERAKSVLGGEIGSAVVFGAGAMGGLAAAHLARAGVTDLMVVNRTFEKAQHLAANVAKNHGVDARAVEMDDLTDALAGADVLVTCTGTIGTVVGVGEVHSALARRTAAGPLVICDLGLPRNVDPAAGRLPDVHIIDIEGLRGDEGTKAADADEVAARDIVLAELADYLTHQRQAEVTPTVTALRQRAAEVVQAEMLRLESRLPGLDDPQRDEVAKTVRRVVDKLLHAPTVRVKQLASTPAGDHYAEALRELFELKPGAAESVSAPEVGLEPNAAGDAAKRSSTNIADAAKRSSTNIADAAKRSSTNIADAAKRSSTNITDNGKAR